MAEVIIRTGAIEQTQNYNVEALTHEELRRMIYNDVSNCVFNGYIFNSITLDGVELYNQRRDRIWLPEHLFRNTMIAPYSPEEQAEYDAIYTLPQTERINNIVDTIMAALL